MSEGSTPTGVSAPMSSTAAAVLTCPLAAGDDSGAATVGEYLAMLLTKVWVEEESFNGKRPFGNSGWTWSVHAALARAGLISGSFSGDKLLDMDEAAGDQLIRRVIAATFAPTASTPVAAAVELTSNTPIGPATVGDLRRAVADPALPDDGVVVVDVESLPELHHLVRAAAVASDVLPFPWGSDPESEPTVSVLELAVSVTDPQSR